MIIIGITGTLGAGKGTIVDYLVQKKGFMHFSVRTFITKVILEKEMPVNRDSMVMIANELRAKNHPAYIVEQLYLQALSTNRNCIIESIRTPGEVDLLRTKANFYLFAVDADPSVRYERIVGRNNETDQVSFTEFLSNEQREMESTDPNKQNISRCFEMADFRLLNNGSFLDLQQQVESILAELKLA